MNKLFFLLFGIFASLNLCGQPNYPTDPEQARLIYTDLENFLEAYQQLVSGKDTIAILEEFYFNKASVGLKEYINRHGLNPELLKNALAESPDEYRSVATFLKGMDDFQARYRELMHAYKASIPSAQFPPTYLLVGANRGIAQASPVGQLVTIIRNINKPYDQDQKLTTIAHELTHFQQARKLGYQQYIATYQKEGNMLDLILREGGAEFVAYFLVRKNTDTYKTLTYVNERLEALKKRFQEDLAIQDSSFWLWESINQKETPILLGYTLGYKICEAYYQRVEDKAAAVEQILGISDPEGFLEKSGFLWD